jgi:hypothetical protein
VVIRPTDVPGPEEVAERERLRASLASLRRRMLLLARLLPLEQLHLLEDDLDDLEAEAFGADLLEGLSDSAELVSSDVETTLREVWARTQAG